MTEYFTRCNQLATGKKSRTSETILSMTHLVFRNMVTECGVCFELFEDEGTTKCPKLLPCSHTFCVSCLTQLEENGAIKCPNCRAVHLIPNGVIENFPTDQIETIPRSNTNKIYILSSSVESTQTGDNGPAICEKHGRPLITFFLP